MSTEIINTRGCEVCYSDNDCTRSTCTSGNVCVDCATEMYEDAFEACNEGEVSAYCAKDCAHNDASPSPSPSKEPATPSNVPVVTPTPNPGTCFPETSIVTLEDGSKKEMRELEINDRVKIAKDQYSSVFAFTHRSRTGFYEFLQLETEQGHKLQLTPGHHIYINGRNLPAKEARIGDVLINSEGESVVVSSIKVMENVGLYNPQTLQGNIIVDGILASTYTESIDSCAAHSLLAPVRSVYRATGLMASILKQSS